MKLFNSNFVNLFVCKPLASIKRLYMSQEYLSIAALTSPSQFDFGKRL